MGLENLAAVQARIDTIQRRFAPPPRAAQTVAPSTFAAELDRMTGSTAATVAAPAADGHTHTKAPAELAAYGNGRIPATALAPIGVGQHRMWSPAATGFTRLRADAAADGVRIGVTDSYRSYDQQVDLARRKGLYRDGGLAATPGTSNHGWGLSLDLDLNPAAQRWMRANAGRYGFAEDVPREPWHWTFTTGVTG